MTPPPCADLLPCPFCGHQPYAYTSGVECRTFGCISGHMTHAAWNRRAHSPAAGDVAGLVAAPLADHLRILRARLFDQLSPAERNELEWAASLLDGQRIVTKEMVDRFLAWPLPASVCSDLCVTKKGAPHRIGTNLLTADEARQMLEYVTRAPAAEGVNIPMGENNAILVPRHWVEVLNDMDQRHYARMPTYIKTAISEITAMLTAHQRSGGKG